MRLKYFFITATVAIVLLLTAVSTSAQVAPMRGTVKLVGSDGQSAPVAGALVDVFRTDIAADYHTKTDKKGEWIFAGLPYVGTYLVAVSAPGAQPNARGGVTVKTGDPVNVVLMPGDGKRLTLDEAKAAVAGGSPSSGGGDSASTKAKLAEETKKKAEVDAANTKIVESNKIVEDSFVAGNAALQVKNFDEAIKQYDTGLAADSDQPSLLTQKAQALKGRGVEHFNGAIKIQDVAAQTAAMDSAKADFKAAAEATNKAYVLIKALAPATDPAALKQQEINRNATLAVRAETMRLFVTKVDLTQAEAGGAAYDDYLAVETDPAKKSKAQMDKAQMLFDAGASEKAIVEFKKILDAQPDNADALYGMGIAEISVGYSNNDKAKLQEGVNYLQQFVDKAPDTHRFKSEAKATLAELKNTEKVVPDRKPVAPGRKRP
jgi:tetratricopeptide (TPR) repeat protein